jgi:hypothetical protein
MSTILYDTARFLQIRESLRLKTRDLAFCFGYPEGWDKPETMSQIIDNFVQDICRANTRAYNDRYESENQPETILPSRHVLPFPTTHALVKALHAIDYNLDDANVNGCAKVLHGIIYHLMYEIVSASKQYQAAEW